MNGLRFNEARATLRLVRIAMLLQNMVVRSFSEDRYLLWLRRYFVLLSLVFAVLCLYSFTL